MAFNDFFRLSSHAVITNDAGQVLLLQANYGNHSWGLPGGALEPGETIHEALRRECKEELGSEIEIRYLSGVYFHKVYNAQVFIFRCKFGDSAVIQLSHEHSGYCYADVDTLSLLQRQRINDCMQFKGTVVSAKF